jgi:hypothetical protein
MKNLLCTLTSFLFFFTITAKAELYSFSYTFETSEPTNQAHSLSGIVEGNLLDDGDTIVVTNLVRVSYAGIYYRLSDDLGIRATEFADQPRISLSGDTLDFWVCTEGFSQLYEDGSGECQLETESGFLVSDAGFLDVIEPTAFVNIVKQGDNYRASNTPLNRANWRARQVPTRNTGLTVFADNINVSWPLWDCCAGSIPRIQQDDVNHGSVVEFSILASPETVQGFYSRNGGQPYDASSDKTFSFEMKIVSATTDANTPWFLKIEADNDISNSIDFNLNTSNEGMDPVVGEWQTYTFDVTALSAAGINISAIDVTAIFPAWGLGSGAVYRIDNVRFGDGGSNGEELITNGGFDNDIEGWTAESDNIVVQLDNDNNVLKVDVSVASESSDVNLSQALNLLTDASYILSFKGKASVERSIIAGIELSQTPSLTSAETVELGTDWQNYSYTLKTPGFGEKSNRVFFDIGAEVGTVYIDDVSVTLQTINVEPESVPLPVSPPISPVVDRWPTIDCIC